MLPASREQPAPCKDSENKDTTYAPERLFSLKTTAGEPAATRRMQVKFFRPAGQRAPRGSTAWLTATCQAHRREPQNRPPGRAERAVWRCKHCRLAPPNGGLRHAQGPGVMLFHGRCRRQPRRQAAARRKGRLQSFAHSACFCGLKLLPLHKASCARRDARRRHQANMNITNNTNHSPCNT